MELNLILTVDGPVERIFAIPADDHDFFKQLGVLAHLRGEILSALEYEFGQHGLSFKVRVADKEAVA